MGEPLKLSSDLSGEGRFHRQTLIEWWDQQRLANARVLVIGAGALGNEILKNLALVGVGAVFIADMDTIEHSNLARSVLFREDDIGRAKAPVAGRRARELYPDLRVQPFAGNIVHDMGLGVFRWADVTICGLDNREARVAVNRSCLRVGRPWVDGAIERLDGNVRVFLPDSGACYECTMNETDWRMLEARRSCSLLTRRQMLEGRTPTTATSSSIIAGFQCQQALKLLHGLPIEGGSGIVVNGQSGDIYTVIYPRKDDCAAHGSLARIVELPQDSSGITMAGLLARAREDLGPEAYLELSRDVLHELACPACERREALFVSLGMVTEADARCPHCGADRVPLLLHSLYGDEEFLGRTPAGMGLPPYDIVTARSAEGEIGYLIAGDRALALGAVAD